MLALLLFFAVAHATAATTEDEWVIALDSSVDPHHYAATNNFTLKGPVSFLPASEHVFIFTAPHVHGHKRVVRTAPDGTEGARWADQQVATQRLFTRSIDPLYEQQWHLHTHPASLDADHAGSLTGAGITIAIVDDGLQHSHPDLAANYDAPHSWDYNGHDPDPTPSPSNAHGTAVAGLAAAVKENGHCGRGVAPRSKLVGVRAVAAPITDVTEGSALSHNGLGVVDIYSCSWGPIDDGMTMEGPGNVVSSVFNSYTANLRGRLGKGSIYVWAAGNGGGNQDYCSFDNYASSPYVFPIGALDYSGQQAWYSESCAALLAVTPSSGTAERITTVDLMGAAGYDPGECTNSFGGTSASAPQAAGVIALILEARPQLTWRDVKHVIAKAAVQVHASDPSWHINARGYHHSPRFGFGVLKVPALIAAARAHVMLAQPLYRNTYVSPATHFEFPRASIPFTYTLNVTGSVLTFIEHVQLRIGITHAYRGRISIELQSPEGAVSVLAPERPKDSNADYPGQGWVFTSIHHWGESHANGPWTIRVRESALMPVAQRNLGLVNGIQLTLIGS